MITWFLKTRLRLLSARAAPERKFLQALERTLQERGYAFAARSWWPRLWKTALVSGSVMTSLAAATATYAYVSPDVLPDHPLYGLRTAIEHIETRLASTPAAKQAIELEHLHRRLQEAARILTVKQQPLPPAHTQRILKTIARVNAQNHEPEQDSLGAVNKQYTKDMLGLQGNELDDLADQGRQAQDPEDQTRVKTELVQEIQDMDENVGLLSQPAAASRDEVQDQPDADIQQNQ